MTPREWARDSWAPAECYICFTPRPEFQTCDTCKDTFCPGCFDVCPVDDCWICECCHKDCRDLQGRAAPRCRADLNYDNE